MRRATVSAPANIAFVKYWGARDLEAAVPANPSISMTLEICRSHTTLELAEDAAGADEVWWVDEADRRRPADPAFAERVRRHLDRLREATGARGVARVATRNTFPAAAGIASSASGGAALALAFCRAAGWTPTAGELSHLARLGGSGSAARSVLGGFVEWPSETGASPETLPATQIAAASHWPLCDVVAVVETEPKAVSSREGHRRAPSSPFFATRQRLLPGRLEAVRRAVAERDLAALGPVLEEEAVELHLVAMSSRPPVFYWSPASLAVLERVRRLRDEGLPAFATMDAGANVHVICEPAVEPAVATALAAVPGVRRVLRDRAGDGPRDEPEAAP